LKDIANDLGLSVVTISKVLRNHPDIAAETRRRVLKRMRELNYQPNFAARSLVSGRTWTLGLVVPVTLPPQNVCIMRGRLTWAEGYGRRSLRGLCPRAPRI
jgi:LacI family transcriptional regulator